jgi:hypothetical protein
MSPAKVVPSAAAKVLRIRALQCSFSSVFHLRQAGMNPKDATFIENLFCATVGLPLVLTGATGLYVSLKNNASS